MNDEQVSQDFRALYAQDMHREDEEPITDITLEELRDAFRHVKKNASGPDAWEDVTLSKLSKFTDTPHRMLNEIERAVGNGQDRLRKHTPLAYRKRAKPATTPWLTESCSSCHRSTENGPR